MHCAPSTARSRSSARTATGCRGSSACSSRGTFRRPRLARILGRDLGDAMLHDDFGAVLHQLGDQRGALDQYARAIALDPGMRSSITTGRPCCATSATPKAPRQASTRPSPSSPDDYEAYNGRAQLRRQTREQQPRRTDRARSSAHVAARPGWQLRYALAKELEDLGDFARAFARLSRARTSSAVTCSTTSRPMWTSCAGYARSSVAGRFDGQPQAGDLRGADFRGGPAEDRDDARGAHPRQPPRCLFSR